MITTPLFEGHLVRLTPIDMDSDPQIESTWSYDLDYVRAVRPEQPPRLLWPQGIKETREKQIKEAGENRLRAYFAIRTQAENQLVGFFHIPYTNLNHNGRLDIVFGHQEWEEQYGNDALEIGLRYVFDELNFHRLNMQCPEYAENLIRILTEHGFSLEVRRREVIYAHGRRWDQLRFGLLESEWRSAIKE